MIRIASNLMAACRWIGFVKRRVHDSAVLDICILGTGDEGTTWIEGELDECGEEPEEIGEVQDGNEMDGVKVETQGGIDTV